MFQVINRFLQLLTQNDNDLFSHEVVSQIIDTYARGDNWHNLDKKKGNLGYGFIHYSLIRVFQPKKVLVIGSRYGLIPVMCALACRDNQFGKVDFVDASYDQNDPAQKNHWGGVGFWKKVNPQKYFGQVDAAKYIQLHVSTSQNFAKKHPKDTWNYVYIDGDHSYQGVKSDFNLFASKVPKGGIVSIHDIFSIDKDKGDYGVVKFWKEVKKNQKYAPLEFPGQYGLGVLQKR